MRVRPFVVATISAWSSGSPSPHWRSSSSAVGSCAHSGLRRRVRVDHRPALTGGGYARRPLPYLRLKSAPQQVMLVPPSAERSSATGGFRYHCRSLRQKAAGAGISAQRRFGAWNGQGGPHTFTASPATPACTGRPPREAGRYPWPGRPERSPGRRRAGCMNG